jgi:hypothetical protein
VPVNVENTQFMALAFADRDDKEKLDEHDSCKRPGLKNQRTEKNGKDEFCQIYHMCHIAFFGTQFNF